MRKTLLPGETIVYQARLHWFRYLQCLALGVTGALLFSFGMETPYWYGIDGALMAAVGALLLCAAPILMAKAWFDQITSEFVVTETRVLIKYGFIRRRSLELLLTKVESIGVDQSILGRLFGFGTIMVMGSGATKERFNDIADPLELRWQVQAIASGQFDAIRQRNEEREALQGQRPTPETENRLGMYASRPSEPLIMSSEKSSFV